MCLLRDFFQCNFFHTANTDDVFLLCSLANACKGLAFEAPDFPHSNTCAVSLQYGSRCANTNLILAEAIVGSVLCGHFGVQTAHRTGKKICHAGSINRDSLRCELFHTRQDDLSGKRVSPTPNSHTVSLRPIPLRSISHTHPPPLLGTLSSCVDSLMSH